MPKDCILLALRQIQAQLEFIEFVKNATFPQVLPDWIVILFPSLNEEKLKASFINFSKREMVSQIDVGTAAVGFSLAPSYRAKKGEVLLSYGFSFFVDDWNSPIASAQNLLVKYRKAFWYVGSAYKELFEKFEQQFSQSHSWANLTLPGKSWSEEQFVVEINRRRCAIARRAGQLLNVESSEAREFCEAN